MKKLLVFIIPAVIIVLVIGFFIRRQNTLNTIVSNPVETINPLPSSMVKQKLNQMLPLRQEDVIGVFFEQINGKKIPEAIAMMDEATVGDDSAKQAWGVQFNSLSEIKIEKIEPSMREEWTDTTQTYRVDLILKVDPSAASAPIPNYGWESGKNTRWVGLIKNEKNRWKVSGIGTGP